MNINFELNQSVLNRMSSECLREMVGMAQYELNRRSQMTMPSTATYQSLVNQFGLDGQKQLNQNFNGLGLGFYQQAHQSDVKYLLSDIPFDVVFDNGINQFVYTPTDQVAKRILALVSPVMEGTLTNFKQFEILIDPHLGKNSSLAFRDAETNTTLMYGGGRLKDLVEWYRDQYNDDAKPTLPAVVPLRALVNVEDPQSHMLTKFNGESVVGEFDLGGNTCHTAPVKIGYAFNLNAQSTLAELIDSKTIPQTADAGPNLSIKSAYVQIGKHLVRMMTETSPYSCFQPSATPGVESLSLHLAAIARIGKNDTDAFGNPYSFAALLDDEDFLTVEIRVSGTFHRATGIFSTNPGNVTVTHSGSPAAEVVAALLHESAEVLAVEPIGEVRF